MMHLAMTLPYLQEVLSCLVWGQAKQLALSHGLAQLLFFQVILTFSRMIGNLSVNSSVTFSVCYQGFFSCLMKFLS